jgi:uncharacterized protein YbjT (DUF2867 family)
MPNKLYADIAQNTQGKHIMLVGSSGNIGGQALSILLQYGKAASITAFDKKAPKIKDLPETVKVCCAEQGDITSADAVEAAMRGNSVVVCAIGVPRYLMPGEKKLTPDEIERQGMQHIVEAAKKTGVQQIIYISALGVVRGDKIPAFHLAHLAKRQAEELLTKSGIAYTILRPSGYYFDFRELLAAAVAGRYHVVDEGLARVQPLHHEDMADILIASINNKKAENKIIAVGGPEIFTYAALGTVFGNVLQTEVNVIHLAPEKYKKEYFNSDLILFRATSDSMLTEEEQKSLQDMFPGLELKKLGDYLNNPNDPMLKSFFKKISA